MWSAPKGDWTLKVSKALASQLSWKITRKTGKKLQLCISCIWFYSGLLNLATFSFFLFFFLQLLLLLPS